MASSPELRERNLGLVLTAICQTSRSGGQAQAAAPSRSQIARLTGLHKTTVSQLADELLAAGLVRELAPAPGGGSGRPALPLAPAPGRLAALGLEVNVEYLGVRAVDLSGAVAAERLERGDLRGSDPARVLARLGRLGRDVIARLARLGTPVIGAGLALPGLTTTAGGQLALLNAPNLGWRGLDLRPFQEGLGRPLKLDNEANLAAAAEARLAGPSAAERSFVYLSAEVGIGAGLVSDAALTAGLHGWAGEVGHVTVDPSGPVCTCGARGCLEVYAGRRAIARAAGLPESAGPRAVAAAIAAARSGAGGPAAAGFDGVVAALAAGLSSVLNLLDVTQVVLGGDYAVLAPVLAEPLRSALADRLLAARWGGAEVTVRPARAGASAALDGAAWSVLDRVLANPAPHLRVARSPGAATGPAPGSATGLATGPQTA
ncbi:MAG: ROK family protein [Bifidobacteriaceae bacterium]|jgi:predicted NBD/HSP70 family sugar kinase|nr:ROK family protein [Bifidobacteriaceae bacterium]